MTARDEQLRRGVELALARLGRGAVTAIHEHEFGGATSYAARVLRVEVAGGDAIEIFLKDFGRTALPKDRADRRRERERRVYEELLNGLELGTPRLYGASWDAAAPRFWLMLELVPGELLRDCHFERWLDAAAWLGRLHGAFAGRRAQLERCDFLVRHDAHYFRDAAEHAVRELPGGLARRLAPALARHDELVPALSRDPRMLVHGSYRSQNVLMAGARVCPIDWELAAFGHPAYDLAYLCDGFRTPRLDALLDAYEREAQACGFAVGDRDVLLRELDAFRLHKTISSLGHLRQWPRPLETATKVVAAADELAGVLP